MNDIKQVQNTLNTVEFFLEQFQKTDQKPTRFERLNLTSSGK